VDVSNVEPTRRALHAVAELVLAGPQYRTSGTIRLRIRPGGFETRAEPRLRVDGAELVFGAQRVPLVGTTCEALGRSAGVDAGAPAGLYQDGSGAGPGEFVDADPEAARWIAGCFEAGDAAMRRFAPDQEPVLWPEHFDVGIAVDGVNYGVAPGDAFCPEPYAYIGPTEPRQGEFWNAPFGAARPMRNLAGAEGVLAFFKEGRRRAARRDP